MKVKFFGPHPGFAGAAIPLPREIKIAIDALDGQEIDLNDALAELTAVITTAGIKAELEIHDKHINILGHGSIALWMPKKIKPGTRVLEPTHLFRLIRFQLSP